MNHRTKMIQGSCRVPRRMVFPLFVATIALLLFLVNLPCFGQAFTANLTGVLADPTSSVIPGATVSLMNTATNEKRTTKTSAEGRYVFSQLLPGSYELSAEATGFKTFVRQGVVLSANQTAEVNASMQVGATTERIEVTGAAPPLDTQTADQTMRFGTESVENLPLNTRTPFGFVRANGGFQEAFDIRNANQDQNYDRFGINGGRTESSAVLIDGVRATSGSQWNGLIYSPTVDSVQEMQVISNSYDVQFGRSGGAVVSLVTKGGSDQFHGSAFEYFRNSDLDATDFFTNKNGKPKPYFGRNQFGGSLGGPIWKSKKVFFFGSYEGLLQGTPATRLASVPTQLQHQGDFSQTFNSNGSLQTIFDPATTVVDAAGNATRTPFAGNIIPTSRFDPVGAKVMAIFPLPNQAGSQFTNANNWFGTGKNIADTRRYDIRSDWVRSEKHSMYVVWSQSPVQVSTPPNYPGWGIGETGTYSPNPRSHATLGNTFTPNATWVINVLAGYGAWTENTIPNVKTPGTAVGLPQSLVSQFQAPGDFPQFAFSNYSTLGAYETLHHPESTRMLEVNVTRQQSAHSVKFGFSLEYGYENGAGAGGWVTAPQFSFSQGFTSGPNVVPGLTTSGNALASLLLGTGSGGSDQITAPLAEGHHDYGFYLQDAWRVNQRLTVNMGLRYELQQPSIDRYNRYSNFNTTIPSPLAGPTGLPLTGGLVFNQGTNVGRGAWDTQYANLSPRVSLAYKVTDKLVARAGFGIFYLPLLGLGTLDGYSLTTQFQTSVGGAGLQPLNILSNPFPQGLLAPPGSALGLLTDVGSGVPLQERKYPNGYVENYSFDLQYQLGRSSMLEVGYSGNQGHHLTYNASINIDQLPVQDLSLGNQLNSQVRNPFYGTAGATGVYTGTTTALWRLLVPYPQFTGVSVQAPPAANSNYNALILRYSQRMSHGLTAMVNYQYSKAIDDASETQAWEEGDTGTRNAYNWNLDRSISAHDIPQSLAMTFVYDLPVGKGRTFGANMNKVAEGVVGGWHIASVMNFQNGIPDHMTAPGNGFGFAYQPPNIANNTAVAISNPTVQEWFNTAALTAPAPYTIGNAARRITQLRQDGVHAADVSVMKTFMIREPLKLQFRAEFFNISNTPQFSAPNTSVGSSTFGQVTGLWNTPRDVQFGLRLDF
jgi:hypothetical protein